MFLSSRRFVPAVRALALAGAVCALPLLAAPAGAQTTVGSFVKAGVADSVIAKVNGIDVKRADLVAALSGLPEQIQQMPIDQVLPVLIERLIDQQLIASEARKGKLDQDADVKRRVADYEAKVLQEVYLTREIAKKLSEAELKKRYAEFLKANPPQEEIRARHILVESEQTAKEIIAELKKGKDFAELAKSKSRDGSAGDGGDLGFFTREDMVKEFADAAFALKPGDVTQAPVKSQFGWHVIKLEQRRTQTPPSFEDARDQLTSEASQELISVVVEELRKGAKVEKFDEAIKALTAAPAPAPTPAPAPAPAPAKPPAR